MKQYFRLLYMLFVTVVTSCASTKNTTTALQDDGKIEVVFVQVNDVYEIAPLAGGKE